MNEMIYRAAKAIAVDQYGNPDAIVDEFHIRIATAVIEATHELTRVEEQMTFASCLNCRFALRVDEQESYCRRHAPVVMIPEGYRAPVTRSPNTYDQNWCGDHEPVPKPAIPGVVAVFANQQRDKGDVQITNEWNCD